MLRSTLSIIAWRCLKSRGKKWSVNPFQTPEVQETEYTYSSANFRNYEKNKTKKLGYFTKSAHACFTVMFRNEHRWNLIVFLAWHVIESHFFKEESSLIFSAKKWMLLKRGTGSGERGTGNGERKSGNELSAETSTKIQNGGPKNERERVGIRFYPPKPHRSRGTEIKFWIT